MWKNISRLLLESLTNQKFFFCIEINGNFIFAPLIFTLRTVFVKRIMFVNGGMGVVV